MRFFKTLGLGLCLALIIFLFFGQVFFRGHDLGFLSGVPLILGTIGATVMVVISLVVGGILHFSKTPTNKLPPWIIYPLIGIILLILGWIFFETGLPEIVFGRH